ncbi:prephenate dehydrogenase [Nakamurella deserti]|uniref:prephenate dehydrogenase n=1 Tax=Nakamurella deserti TaxID=2164074 RepID=UPI001F0BEADC|nr:prephenate dehydrogenase [Nakamurella deserti]
MSTPPPGGTLPPVCVLGLGLIGGSLLRAAAPATTVYGWSRSADTRAAAAGDGFTVLDDLDATLDRARADDALVVLASPVTAFRTLLKSVHERAPQVRLTDVASVKGSVAQWVAELAPRTRFVGSHPMAGTQHSGWEAGSADLFAGAAWVTCLDEDADVADWVPVARLGLAVGSRIVPCEAVAHDRAAARISHLPHLMACAMAQVGEMGGELAMALAAGSFADGTRVAATRPELMRAMCENNAAALVDALDDVLGILGVARASLASTGSLQKITSGGHDARMLFEGRGADLISVQLDGDDLVDQLLSVGVAGGHVSGITGPDDAPLVDAHYPDPAGLD